MYATETSIVTLYSFDKQGVACGSFPYKWVEGTGLAANSTLVPPPNAAKGFASVWNGKAWVLREDHRGKTIYSITDKSSKEVEAVGKIEVGYTLIEPNPFDTWNGAAWEDQRTSEEKKIYERSIMPSLSPLEFDLKLAQYNLYDAVQALIATNLQLKIAYTRATFFSRTDQFVDQARIILSLTNDQVDEMWTS